MENIKIHPTVNMSEGCVIGAGTKVWINSQIRENVFIGKDCIIGKDTYIDHDVTIGNRVKIQNGVSIYYGITVKDDVFIGPNAVFTNDYYPRAFNKEWIVTQTLVMEGASIGANATIICGITLGKYCMVGAGSVVTKDVPDHALVVGNPAHIIGYVCKCGRRTKLGETCDKCRSL